MHSEQNGPIYQEVTLGSSDVAPVCPLAEGRAGVLECCLNGKRGNHGPHLRARHTATDDGRGRVFGPHRGPGFSCPLTAGTHIVGRSRMMAERAAADRSAVRGPPDPRLARYASKRY